MIDNATQGTVIKLSVSVEQVVMQFSMINKGVSGVEFIAANTDSQSARNNPTLITSSKSAKLVWVQVCVQRLVVSWGRRISYPY